MRPRLLVAAPAAAVLLVALAVGALATPTPVPTVPPGATATPYPTPYPTPYATPYATPSPVPTVPEQQTSVQQAVEGNVATCEQAGLPGELIHFISGPTSSFNATITGRVTDRRVLDVQTIDNAVITGVVVDGGPTYNVYTQAPFVGLTPPVNPQTNTQQIQYWMVCGWDLGSGAQPGTRPWGYTVPAHVPAGVDDAAPAGGDARVAPASLVTDTSAPSPSGGPSWGLIALTAVGVTGLVGIAVVLAARRQHSNPS
jgi:hypothetical protein